MNALRFQHLIFEGIEAKMTSSPRPEAVVGGRVVEFAHKVRLLVIVCALAPAVRATGQNVQLIGAVNTLAPAEGVFVSNNLAYLACSTAGLQIIDVSTPGGPFPRGRCNTPGQSHKVFVSMGIAYVAAGNSGLQIIDISNPAAPVLRGSYNTPGAAWDVFVSGNLAFVADYDGGLQVIDVAIPDAPVSRGSYLTPYNATGVFAIGALAFVADREGGLLILNYTGPVSPSTPSNLVAVAGSASQIGLSWQDNSANETGFRIESRIGLTGAWLLVATVGANVRTYQNIGLLPETPYYYRVRAFNSSGNSGWSNVAFAATPDPTAARPSWLRYE
jgi:hypothetical protein